MKRIDLWMLLLGMLCCVSCASKDNATEAVQKSDSMVKTETTQTMPKETPAKPEPVVTKSRKPQMPSKNPVVKIVTTKGEIDIELYADKAPITVENFLGYVNSGFYNGTVFHRVIPNFMIQGGGMTPDMRPKKTKAPIKNEAANGLKNKRGTIAMARTPMPDSATSQFFINHKDNVSLDYRDSSPRGIGYAVFGKVIEGMEVVDAIAVTPTRKPGDVPIETVVIESIAMK